VTAVAQRSRLRGPLGISLLLHASIVALALLSFGKSGPQEALPPIYKVNIVAAPPGERAIGEVRPPDATRTPTPKPVPVPVRPEPKVAPVTKTTAAKTARSTPTETPAAAAAKSTAPRAGGGPIGGSGTDVATVQTEGIDFPFPGYLNNIVRQVALAFKPTDTNSGFKAEVMFLIHRDGSVTNFRFVTKSGAYAFDLEAQGAIEAASRYFGPLPEGFRDDVLPVVFSFDPRFLR
jgi:outer membrane biosynthesis protein TonB